MPAREFALQPPPPTPGIEFDPADMDQQLAVFMGIMRGDNYIDKAVQDANAAPASPALSPVDAPRLGQAGADQGTAQEALTQGMPAPEAPKPDSNEPQGFGGDNLQSGSWTHDLLAAVGITPTYENVRALQAWQKAEGGGSDGPSRTNFNWLNTTQGWAGATSVNKVGVKSYASYNDGILATAKTLVNGRYGAILAALTAGNDAVAVGRAIEASPWGTGGGTLRVLGAGR